MKIETVAIKELIQDETNVRSHDERNISAIKASLTRFGQQKPIVVNTEGVVVAGNGTLAAAEALGWAKIRVIRTTLKGNEAATYAIADNRTAELAVWDDVELAKALVALQNDDDIDHLATGFTDKEIDSLVVQTAGDVVEDEVPAVPDDPVTKLGDLWLLGDHRLLCGDSTKAEDVERVMGGAKADLWLTDPPYNVDYTGKTKDALKISNDTMSDGEFRRFLIDTFRESLSVMKPGASFYIWHADLEGYNFRGAIHECGQRVRQCLIWKKQTLVMGRQDYHWMHEPCLYGWKDGAAHGWYTDRKQTTVLEFDRPGRSVDHPTMKPVALISYQIGNSTAPQGLVLDTFLGSGTTLIAAEQLGRKCYGIEISPAYCDVIVKRWENLTGNKAVLAETEAVNV